MSRNGPTPPPEPEPPPGPMMQFPAPSSFGFQHPSPPGDDDPLVFDLAGTGFDFTPVSQSNAFFAYDPAASAIRTGWVKPSEGILVIDRHPGSLQVTADELLGAQSGNGLADLAALDTNHDGKVDAQDTGAADLKMWIDANGDGITDPGELVSLNAAGIASIQLASQPGLSSDVINGTRIAARFSFTRLDGSSGNAAEVFLPVDHLYTHYKPPAGFQYVANIDAMPFLLGYGNVPSLAISMTLQPDLLAEVKTLVLAANTMTSRDFNTAFEHILFNWAGVGSVDPASRGAANDARHIGVVEAFYGLTWAQSSGSTANPHASAAREYEATYQSILDELKIRFVAQVSQSQLALGVDPAVVAASPLHLFDQILFDPYYDHISLNFSDLVASIIGQAPTGAGKLAWFDQTIPMLRSLRVDLFHENEADFEAAFTTAATAAGLNAPLLLLASAEFAQQHSVYATDGPSVTGSGHDDILLINEGGHTLSGGAGNDTYVYEKAALGLTTIADQASFSNADKLLFADIASTDIVVSRNGASNDLVLTIASTGATLRLVDQFDSLANGTIETLVFADGVTWSASDLKLRMLAAETAGSGPVYGFANSNDILVAGSGDRLLNGLGGADTYVYDASGGNDTIDDGASASSLVMSGINSTDISLSRSGGGDDLVMTDTVTGKSVTIRGEFSPYGWGTMASVSFADGVSWSIASLRQKVLEAATAAASGSVYGFGRSNDVLVAGVGDKYLNGLGGADTYVYSASGGNDTIEDGANASSLVMSGIASTSVALSRAGASEDLVITNRLTGKSVTIKGEFSPYAWGAMQAISFSDGVSWDAGTIRQKLLDQGTASGQASIFGYGRIDDVIVAGAGDRYLNGLGGSDTYVYSASGGNDTIEDGASASSLVMSGILSTGVTMRRSGEDLVISIAATGKTLTVKGEFSPYGWGTMRAISFADGVSYDLAGIVAATSNHAPTAIQAAGASVARLAGVGTLVGVLTTTDIDVGDSHSYAIVGGASTLFTLSGNKIVVRQGAALKAAAGQTYTLNVSSTDSHGLSVTQAISIAVTAPGPRAAQATLIGAAGNNSLVGAALKNTVDYSGSSTRVDINLSTGLASHDGGNLDHLKSIQNVIGTDFGDLLTGTGGGNVFTLGRGQNNVNGLGGRDTVDYSRAGTGVVADLAGQFALHDGVSDSLIALLNVNGSAFNDQLHSAAGGHSVLSGGAGNDALYARGHDTLIGGPGADRFIIANAAAGHDVISDFTPGTDHIALIEGGFGSLHAGDAVHLVSGQGTAAQILGHQTAPAFAFDTATGSLWFNSFAAHSSATLVATLTGVTALAAADLVIAPAG